jgi:spore maturation protein A
LINIIWLIMIVAGVVATCLQPGGDITRVTAAITQGSDEAVRLVISLVGILAFWSGLMRLAEESGLIALLGNLLSPLVRRLFPTLPSEHPAMGAMLLAFSANILGLGNAATPLGIKAVEELQKLNEQPKEASDAICTFVVICASGLTLAPGTVIALRAAAGAKDPTSIVGATLFATACSTIAVLIVDRLLRNRSRSAPPAPKQERRSTIVKRRIR